MEKHLETISEKLMKKKFNSRLFKAFFGISTTIFYEIWSYIVGLDITVEHILWTLYFLKNNPSDDVSNFYCAVKTWKKYVFKTLDILNTLLPEVFLYF